MPYYVANAQVDGERGAMLPWQSGMVGDEQAQFVHLNTVNNEWEPDNNRRQCYVSLVITYNMWVYVQLTGDTSILEECGLDLLVETTKFCLNTATLGQDGRYHIAGVMWALTSITRHIQDKKAAFVTMPIRI